MLVNAKCNNCKEPTKYVVGFFDGKNDSHGFLYDCKNMNCDTKKLLDTLAKQREKEQSNIAEENWKNSIVAKNMTVARISKGMTIYELSEKTGLSSADISAYEHERKAIPVAHYEKIMDSISKYKQKLNLLGRDEFYNVDNVCFEKLYDAIHRIKKNID